MKIIDWYILKRYLATFSVMLLLFIPIGIVIDVSEKVNKMIENQIPFSKVALYYLDFTIYFANLLFPIFLFLSVIWFTSKLANNTEIVAILSSGISYSRFLRPYLVGATLVSILVLIAGFFVVPKASKGFNDFRYEYLKGGGKEKMRKSQDVYRQINDDVYVHVASIRPEHKSAFDFTLEKFDKNNQLKYKITASRIKYSEATKKYTLHNYVRRDVGPLGDKITKLTKMDTILPFEVEDLTPTIYVAETLTLGELNDFIDKERKRGSGNINTYMVVLYKKYSLPVSAFILTLIAVAVSSTKRRGGMGMNLAIGIGIAFAYVFFDKIFGTLAEASSISPFVAVWLPNFLFGILAVYLLRNARR